MQADKTPTATEDNDKLVTQELQNSHPVPSLNVLQTSKRTSTRLYMTDNSDKKLQQLPHKNDIPNIAAAMMQVVPSFPAHHTLPYGQGSLSVELSESQYCC